jgi:hypothetical protein
LRTKPLTSSSHAIWFGVTGGPLIGLLLGTPLGDEPCTALALVP